MLGFYLRLPCCGSLDIYIGPRRGWFDKITQLRRWVDTQAPLARLQPQGYNLDGCEAVIWNGPKWLVPAGRTRQLWSCGFTYPFEGMRGWTPSSISKILGRPFQFVGHVAKAGLVCFGT